MRTSTLIAFTTTLLLGLPALAQPTPVIPSLSQEQVDRLNSGEILVQMNGEVDPPIADAIGVIDATPEQVFAIVADFSRHTEWFDDLALAEVVGEEEGGIVVIHGITDTPWPMDDREWTNRTWGGPMEVDGVAAYISTWAYIEGSGNLENTEGYWLMIPWNEDGTKTLTRYYMILDLGTPMPDFLINWGAENMLPSRIQGIRDRF